MDPPLGSHKVMDAQTLEDILACTKPQEKKVRPPQEQPLKCPRCDSTNTKFCYYNNYSLSQPRYFCKGCKRYWTQGGALRNVPVGGGCRKNKRPSNNTATTASTTATSSLSSRTTQDQFFIPTNSNRIPTLPLLTYDPNDLTLVGFSGHDTNTISFDDILGIPKSSFIDTQCAISYNNYNGVGSDDMGEVVSGPLEDMRGPKATKAEACGGRDGEIDRRLWNFAWQSSGDASLGGMDLGREYWNGFESSWKGLVNNTLM